MTSDASRIRKLQRRLAAVMAYNMSKIAEETMMTPSGWKLTWKPSKSNTVYIDDEKNGTWSDSAIRYSSGKIAYDAPEKIPDDVKKAVKKFFAKVRKNPD